MYSLASLFLLIRSHALEEQAEWLRRRIGDPAAISGIYLRGGSMFIAAAVIGSLLLTQTASSAPLAGAWDGVSDQVIDFSRSVARFLPGGPNTKNFNAEFGDDHGHPRVLDGRSDARRHHRAATDRRGVALLASRHVRSIHAERVAEQPGHRHREVGR